MTVGLNPLAVNSFESFEDLKDSFIYGLNPEELSAKTDQLIRTCFHLKAASSQKAAHSEIISLPNQWIWMEAHHFLESIIEFREKNLIYEWAQILKSKNACLPSNVLPSIFKWTIKDLDLALTTIPVLGDKGRKLAALILEWNLLGSESWIDPWRLDKSDLRVFAFRQFRIFDPEKAFHYFLTQHHRLKGSEKVKCLRILKQKITDHEVDHLSKILDVNNVVYQIELVLLSLHTTDSVYFQQCKQNFLLNFEANTLDQFQFIPLGKKSYIWSNAQKIKCIPLSYLENEALALKYIQWVVEQGYEENLLEAVHISPDLLFLKLYLNILLKNNRLNEHFSTAILSFHMDHKTFNESCLTWIETSGDQLDLEAFLHFINSEKHFWSDNLLAKILEFRTNKVMNRKYDCTIFWQLLPYKVNPNSIHIKSIPSECRIFNNALVHFDSIIEFRKMIRK